MKHNSRIQGEALTFDDVLLLPAESSILPREAKLQTQFTRRIALNIPLLSAAMDTVTESQLAITLASEGGMGVIHKNMSITRQASEVRKVKKFESGMVSDPVTVRPQTSLAEVKTIIRETNFSALPVIEADQQLVGILTSRDMRFAKDLTQSVSALMTPKERLVTVKEGAGKDVVMDLLHRYRIEKVLVVNERFQLRGMITVKDIMKADEKPLACKDDQGQLRVAAAVGVASDTDERIAALVAAGVDVIVIDTAHGHAKSVLERVAWTKAQYPHVDVVGGNVATAAGARALVSAGADAVKVGIGPGSICTTRIISGVGVPQLTAIMAVAEALKGTGVPLIGDGGIRFSGDLCKAIAAGAHSIMVGSLFAGTDEAPGEVELYQGRSYKTYRGMGSLGAMSKAHGSSDRYFQEMNGEIKKLVPEGVEGRVPHKGPLVNVIHQLLGGLRSSMGYTGSADLKAMRTQTEFVQISSAGIQESHVHGVRVTKEAPNYQRHQD